jgi:uncharacterized protein (DUF1501 family)
VCPLTISLLYGNVLVEFGGFDHHSDMKARLRAKMATLDYALGAFVEQLKDDGFWDKVAIVQSSDFARTLTPNSGRGTDHAWGMNTMIMSGDLDGGKILGQYPDDVTPDGKYADGSSRGRYIPTTSNDAIWNGVLQWFGVETDDELDYCLPNRLNTINPFEGTTAFDLYTRDELFKPETASNSNSNENELIIRRRSLRHSSSSTVN